MINVILQFLELDLVNINVSAKFYQNIPNGLRVNFHCFQNLNLGKNRPIIMSFDYLMGYIMSISQSLGLDLVNINVYVKVYQDIPIRSRDRAILGLSANPK